MNRDERPARPQTTGGGRATRTRSEPSCMGTIRSGCRSHFCAARNLIAWSKHFLLRAVQEGSALQQGIGGAAREAISATHTLHDPKATEAFTLAIVADGDISAYPGEARPTHESPPLTKTRATLISLRPNCARSRRTPARMFQRVTSSTKRGSRSIGERLSQAAEDQGEVRS